jgi:hypothetical protein
MPPVDTRLLIPKSRLGDARDEMTGDTAEGMSPDTVWGRRTTDAAIGLAIISPAARCSLDRAPELSS